MAYQLYSWHDTRGWYFSVLNDTNRQKTAKEVLNSKTALKGVDQLERKLSKMPSGSRVIWFDRLTVGGIKIRGSEGLSYPPQDVITEIREYAKKHSIEILGPPGS